MLAKDVPVGSLHTKGGSPRDGSQPTGVGQVVGAGALEVGHGPIKSEVMRSSSGHADA